MRIAVISDIHGNRLALEAVQDDIAAVGVDSVVNLGDLVSGPMEPHWTADILLDADYPTVGGNHDRYLCERSADGLGAVDRFVAGLLEERHLGWLKSLPATLSLDEVFLCHGTPGSDEEPWLDGWWKGRRHEVPTEEHVTARALGIDFPVILCGHTHVPHMVRLRDGRLVVNPGSVGLQTIAGAPDARYAVIERRRGQWTVSFRAVPYDHAAAARQAAANGFPHWTEALTTGWVGSEGLF